MAKTIEDKLKDDGWCIILTDNVDGNKIVYVLLGKEDDRILYNRKGGKVIIKYSMPEDKNSKTST